MEDTSCTLVAPYFGIFIIIKHLILVFLIEENSNRTLLLHFQQNEAPAVPYFSISNRIKS